MSEHTYNYFHGVMRDNQAECWFRGGADNFIAGRFPVTVITKAPIVLPTDMPMVEPQQDHMGKMVSMNLCDRAGNVIAFIPIENVVEMLRGHVEVGVGKALEIK